MGLAFGLLVIWAMGQAVVAQSYVRIDLEEPPFAYSVTADNNRVSRLMAKLKSKEIKLEYTSEHGYLRAMLAALDIS